MTYWNWNDFILYARRKKRQYVADNDNADEDDDDADNGDYDDDDVDDDDDDNVDEDEDIFGPRCSHVIHPDWAPPSESHLIFTNAALEHSF